MRNNINNSLTNFLFFSFFSFLGILFSSSVFSMQVMPVKDNGKVILKIANNDYTRIFVQGDRISDVKGVVGQYNLRQNNQLGQIYIAPTKNYRSKPFNIFISTENGNAYQLLLKPVSMQANSIELQPPVLKSPQAQSWEENTEYNKALTDLIAHMYNGDSLEGFSAQSVDDAAKQPLGNIATITLTTVYVGDHLRGNVYEIINKTINTIRLDETQLYRPGARAIALETQLIPPQGSTRLFMVTDNE